MPPYPPARYTEDEPEVSAWPKRGTEPPDYVTSGHTKYHYLANQQATNGDCGLYRVELPPAAADRVRTFTARYPRRSSSCRGR